MNDDTFDDASVASFAKAMQAKLCRKRAEGRHGWQHCPEWWLWEQLEGHIDKRDPVDIANYCMMIFHVRAHVIGKLRLQRGNSARTAEGNCDED